MPVARWAPSTRGSNKVVPLEAVGLQHRVRQEEPIRHRFELGSRVDAGCGGRNHPSHAEYVARIPVSGERYPKSFEKRGWSSSLGGSERPISEPCQQFRPHLVLSFLQFLDGHCIRDLKGDEIWVLLPHAKFRVVSPRKGTVCWGLAPSLQTTKGPGYHAAPAALALRRDLFKQCRQQSAKEE